MYITERTWCAIFNEFKDTFLNVDLRDVVSRFDEDGQVLDFPIKELDTASYAARIYIDGIGDTALLNTKNLREDVEYGPYYTYAKKYYYIIDVSKDAYGEFTFQ